MTNKTSIKTTNKLFIKNLAKSFAIQKTISNFAPLNNRLQ